MHSNLHVCVVNFLFREASPIPQNTKLCERIYR